ncbi:pseudouridylate synthase [Cladorrhinum sp. PSN259]|nr:pseudouridylate synthase [Cladorrhinum sp. PSN259]
MKNLSLQIPRAFNRAQARKVVASLLTPHILSRPTIPSRSPSSPIYFLGPLSASYSTKAPQKREDIIPLWLRPWQRRVAAENMENQRPDYNKWTKDRLVQRVMQLENELKYQNGGLVKEEEVKAVPTVPAVPAVPDQPEQPQQNKPEEKPQKKKKKDKQMDPSRYSTRLIALKLAYLGKRYGGFEFTHNGAVPTIEEELWKALVRSCLIWPEKPDEVDFTPWEYSKCGRTDRGVSAFGQVIGIRVRSNRPLPPKEEEPESATGGDAEMVDAEADEKGTAEDETKAKQQQQQSKKQNNNYKKPEWDHIADEINYPKILNRLLPPDIRVLGWAPTLPENFSARFSCRERQYRYFFTQPAFSPVPSSVAVKGKEGEGWLDIEAMRAAAKMYEGVHDFRNFCKVDGGKQISVFTRRIFEADIVEVGDGIGSALPYLDKEDFKPSDIKDAKFPKVYYFHVRGSAFLWHQIRHMVAMVFAVGQGLEKPSIITDLLDVNKYPRKPNYVMADDVPLVLWDCIFPKLDETNAISGTDVHNPEVEGDVNMQDSMDWVWMGEDLPSNLHGSTGLADQLWEYWREKKMDELLANQLLNAVATKADLKRQLGGPEPTAKHGGGPKSQRIYDGGNSARATGAYVPVLKRQLMPTPQEINEKWAQSKGFKDSAELAATKNWRTVIKANKAASKASEQ